jgi:hypothetical protein
VYRIIGPSFFPVRVREKKSWKEATSRSPTHKYDRALSWHGTGTSIKCDGVKLVLWAQI